MTEETKNMIVAAIDGTEEILDPLDGLVERTASDRGAAFTPEVVERLAALKKDDCAAFEPLRAQLKGAGCRVTAFDEAIAEESGDVGGRGPTQANILKAEWRNGLALYRSGERWPDLHRRPPAGCPGCPVPAKLLIKEAPATAGGGR
jgi:hypothetical protein